MIFEEDDGRNFTSFDSHEVWEGVIEAVDAIREGNIDEAGEILADVIRTRVMCEAVMFATVRSIARYFLEITPPDCRAEFAFAVEEETDEADELLVRLVNLAMKLPENISPVVVATHEIADVIRDAGDELLADATVSAIQVTAWVDSIPMVSR